MKRSHSTFVALLLFTLMFFKVSSFHVYSHQDTTSDDIENCKICELAIENQDAEYLITAPQTISIPITDLNYLKQSSDYEVVVSSSFLRSDFFGRPPPHLG